MAVRPLVNIERLTTAHVNSIDGSMTYESGISYKANTTVSYNGSLYTANVDIEDTDTDTPDIAPDKWSLTINASESGTSGDISALAARVSALEDTVGDEDSGLVKDVDVLEDTTSVQNLMYEHSVEIGETIIDALTDTIDGFIDDVVSQLEDDECVVIRLISCPLAASGNNTNVYPTNISFMPNTQGKDFNIAVGVVDSYASTFMVFIEGAIGGSLYAYNRLRSWRTDGTTITDIGAIERTATANIRLLYYKLRYKAS